MKTEYQAAVVSEMTRLCGRSRVRRRGKPWPALERRLNRLETYLKAIGRQHDPEATRPWNPTASETKPDRP